MAYSIVTSKGQVTIPKLIRERMGIEEGSRLVFVDDGDRVLLYKVEPDLAGLYGAVKHEGPPLDFEAVKGDVGEAVAKGFSGEGEGVASRKGEGKAGGSVRGSKAYGRTAVNKGTAGKTSKAKGKTTGSAMGKRPKVK